MDDVPIHTGLEQRLGPDHAHRRLAVEAGHEARCFGQGLSFFDVERWYSIHSMIRTTLRLCGLYRRACRNAGLVELRHHTIRLPDLPHAFHGYRLLHLSDLHADMSEAAMERVVQLLDGVTYDVCVLTGDYRGKTFGPFDAALTGVARVVARLTKPVYGVLGNHDSIRMVPGLEALGVRMLLNEAEAIERDGARIHLAGIDDAHFFLAHDIGKAAAAIPTGETAILLSHTPEVYLEAANAGFAVLLAGHTHGGQLCLPGGMPITLDSNLPRRFGVGAWRFGALTGYTSVGAGSSLVAVRLNCRPEITLHRLERAPAQ